ncbi:MAG: PfkB family carbohydrate kinase [Desulfatiglandaceae bacterium]
MYQGVDRVRAPTVPIKSKVGAGDSMVVEIMTALKRGWKIPDAVRFCVAAGAEAVMTEGTELCRREDTERLYERIGNQEGSPRCLPSVISKNGVRREAHGARKEPGQQKAGS